MTSQYRNLAATSSSGNAFSTSMRLRRTLFKPSIIVFFSFSLLFIVILISYGRLRTEMRTLKTKGERHTRRLEAEIRELTQEKKKIIKMVEQLQQKQKICLRDLEQEQLRIEALHVKLEYSKNEVKLKNEVIRARETDIRDLEKEIRKFRDSPDEMNLENTSLNSF